MGMPFVVIRGGRIGENVGQTSEVSADSAG
jgi:hypothetical protein